MTTTSCEQTATQQLTAAGEVPARGAESKTSGLRDVDMAARAAALLLLLLLFAVTVNADYDVISVGDTWKYLDTNENVMGTFFAASFDDSNWKSGKGGIAEVAATMIPVA
jgi:hypothetical protein